MVEQMIAMDWNTIPGVLIKRLRFVCSAQGVNLQDQEGGRALHGALGKVLHDSFPHAYDLLFHDMPDRSWPRLYVLRPPLEQQGHYAPGDVMIIECSLFNEAIDVAPEVTTAMHTVGRLGLGKERGRFGISIVEEVHPAKTQVVWLNGEPCMAPGSGFDLRVLLQQAHGVLCRRLSIELLTPMMLKADNTLQTNLTMPLLVQRLVGRYSQLSRQPLEDSFVRALCELAARVEVVHQGTWMSTDQRYSARQRQVMPQQGVLGRVDFKGQLGELLPWLAMGEWLHVGNKTTFGYGLYRLSRVD